MPGQHGQRELRSDAADPDQPLEQILLERGRKPVERQRVLADVRVNAQRDLAARLAETVEGRERHEDVVADAGHVDDQAIRMLLEDPAAQMGNHDVVFDSLARRCPTRAAGRSRRRNGDDARSTKAPAADLAGVAECLVARRARPAPDSAACPGGRPVVAPAGGGLARAATGGGDAGTGRHAASARDRSPRPARRRRRAATAPPPDRGSSSPSAGPGASRRGRSRRPRA